MLKDRYAKAIEFLTENCGINILRMAWASPREKEGGALFLQCCPDNQVPRTFGCLTQIAFTRSVQNEEGTPLEYHAYTSEMTEKILNDSRIPDDIEKVTPSLFPLFAEYQREMDILYRRPIGTYQPENYNPVKIYGVREHETLGPQAAIEAFGDICWINVTEKYVKLD